MLEFACPSCGKRVQGDDSCAGKHVVCPSCNATCMAPHAAIAPAPRPVALAASTEGGISEGLPPLDAPPPDLRKPPTRTIFSVVWILAAIAVIVIAVGLMVPSVEKVREAAAQTQSTNNLKQLGLGMQSFHDMHRRLPFNGTVPAAANDPTSGSWAFQILPFVDQQALFNQPNANAGVMTYMCPGRGRSMVCATGAWSDYAINPWLNDKNGAPDAPDVKRTLLGITDGTSNTIFGGHGSIDPNSYAMNVAFAQSTDIFKGGDPALTRRSTENRADKSGDAGLHWGGPFPKGSLIVWCDGMVRFLPYTWTGGVIRNGVSDWPDPRPFGDGFAPRNFNQGLGKFLTPTGGEPMTLPD